MLAEVSQCNDDNTDNRFNPPVGRFPAIEEDEPPYRRLDATGLIPPPETESTWSIPLKMTIPTLSVDSLERPDDAHLLPGWTGIS